MKKSNIDILKENKTKYNDTIYITNEGYEIKILNYNGANNVEIQFNNGHTLKSKLERIKIGNIRNPYHKSVYGVGYLGVGKFKAHIGVKSTKMYKVWSGMLERCYSEKYHIKKPTYKDCSVDERWHNFQVFAEWHKKNYKEGFELDKDILVKGNKIYSPETCCFVPQKINEVFKTSSSNKDVNFIRFYKTTKKEYLLKLANNYKNNIPKDCYLILINYNYE
jgi:hypothetical protein